MPEAQARMALMYVNTGATYEWQAGTRNSGFFNSVGRGFRDVHWPMVRDHWAGLADTLKGEEEMITPDEFAQLAEGRGVTIPPGAVPRNVAERQIAKYDREQREIEYERNWRSTLGNLVGAIPAWAVSPEGLVGLAVPPVRLASGARAGIQGARAVRQGSASSAAASRALAEVPAGIAMGGTNLVAQQAAYGEIDALEATVAFAAPSVLGAGIGAIQGIRASQTKNIGGEGKTNPTAPRADEAIDTEVPDRLVNEVRQTFELVEGDTTAQAFAKIRNTLQRNNITPDMMDNLVEGFARLSERRGIRLSTEAQDALARVREIEMMPVRQRSPIDIARQASADKSYLTINEEISRVISRLDEVNAAPQTLETDALRQELLSELASYKTQRRMSDAQRKGAKAEPTAQPRMRDELLEADVAPRNPRVKSAKRAATKARGEEARIQEQVKALEEAGDTARVQQQTERLNAARVAREEADANLAAVENDVQMLRTAQRAEVPDVAAREALRKEALIELADIMARETDAPIPAEFMAELVDNVAASRPVDPDVISGTPRFGVADDETAYAGARSMTEEGMMQRDPAFAALRKFEGADRASQVYARQEQILRDCPL